MKIAVESFTNPIDPTAINTPVEKSFASGGGGGSSSVVVAPHNPAVFRFNGGEFNNPAHGTFVHLGSVTIPLFGNRLLKGEAQCFVGNFLGNPTDINFGLFATFDNASPSVVGNILNASGIHLGCEEVEISYDNPNPPPNTKTTNGPVLFRPNFSHTFTFPLYKDTTGLTGDHTIDLWLRNTSSAHGGAPVGIATTRWNVAAMEMDVI